MIRIFVSLLTLILIFLPDAALAHKPSDSYLTISGEQEALEVRWDIALRDLDHAIGLDDNGDGSVTWGELRRNHKDIAAYALARLTVSGDGRPCTPGDLDHRVDRHSDGSYAVLAFPLSCPAMPTRLNIAYNLFFDLDAQHRGLLSVNVNEGGFAAVLGPESREASVTLGHFQAVQFYGFFLDGIHHLIGGIDHLLFLLVVLLPLISRTRPGAGNEGVSRAFVETAKILTAFTIAHGLTLSAAVLGFLALPSRPVEVAIAASIAITALDNIRPFLGTRRWLVAGGFGLIHGLGFAAVLGPLDLPPASMALALLGFNLGIEAAQLGIALLVLMLGRLVPDDASGFWRPMLRHAGSAASIIVAGAWVVDRSLDLGMMPF